MRIKFRRISSVQIFLLEYCPKTISGIFWIVLGPYWSLLFNCITADVQRQVTAWLSVDGISGITRLQNKSQLVKGPSFTDNWTFSLYSAYMPTTAFCIRRNDETKWRNEITKSLNDNTGFRCGRHCTNFYISWNGQQVGHRMVPGYHVCSPLLLSRFKTCQYT